MSRLRVQHRGAFWIRISGFWIQMDLSVFFAEERGDVGGSKLLYGGESASSQTYTVLYLET